MNTALKEWASVVEVLGSGRQILLLRKGGIVEAHRGGFKLRHREFLFFPTFEHQHRDSLKPEFQHLAQPVRDHRIPINLLGKVTDVFPAPADLEGMRRGASHYIWNDRFLEMRYGYRPDLPLYLVIIRALRLPAAAEIANRPSYAGCKSWVYLTEEIPTSGAEPVLDDFEFASARGALLGDLGLEPAED